MSLPLQFETPTALQYFAALVAEDEGFPLLEAALALAQDDLPQLDVQGELAAIDALGLHLVQRVPADAVPLQRLRMLNRYFFHELGFAGNVNNFYDRRNSLLPVVLQTRRGIPISLALLYIELAAQAKLQAVGIAFPGHFLVKVHLHQGEVVIDPCSGRSLSREVLEDRLLPFRQRQHLAAEDEAPLGLYLQAALGRDVIARMLRNLKEIHRSVLDWERLAQVQQRLVILLPQAWDEYRDLALALAELGCHAAATVALQTYLKHRPRAVDAPALRRHLASWKPLP